MKTRESIVLSDSAFVRTRTLSDGQGGDIQLKTQRLKVKDAGVGSANFLGRPFEFECLDDDCEQTNFRPLDVDDVRAVAKKFPDVEIVDVGQGQTGAISIRADRVSLFSSAFQLDESAIASLTASDGDAGGIFMNVGRLDSHGSVITLQSGVISTRGRTWRKENFYTKSSL